jgi:ethanolamine ammonia-lyase large subunit
MSFTYTGFVNNISGMTISGVTRRYTAPPATMNTADLPASYPRIPGGDNQSVTLTSVSGLRLGVVELCIVLEPVRQATNSVNFAAALTMLDAIETALQTNARTYQIDRWSIQLEIDRIGADTDYWQLVARVEGSGT